MIEQLEDNLNSQDKRIIKILSNGISEIVKPIKISILNETTFGQIKRTLETVKQFQNIKNLRLFNVEGVELFQEDIPFVKNESILFASSNGEDFDSNTGFQQFEMIKLLGEGGFGKVLLAQHRVTKQKVAIKIMNTATISNAEDIDMVFREAEMLKQLHHKNIVDIYNCFTLPNMNVVFVMEYLEGGELLKYIQDKGQISEQEARMYLVQMVDAIGYCHSQKLIHRDLKLENIMLAQQGKNLIKIVDFGIAGIANNFSVDKIDAGSLNYMAPELFTQKLKKLGPHIDIWALGVILYGMVFGELPYNCENQNDIINAICTATYTIPKDISPELRDLLSRIFTIDHNKRIRMTDIQSHPWVLGINQEPNYQAKYLKNTVKLPNQRVNQLSSDLSRLARKPGIYKEVSRQNQNTQSIYNRKNSGHSKEQNPEEIQKSIHPLLNVPKEVAEYLPQLRQILIAEGKLEDKQHESMRSMHQDSKRPLQITKDGLSIQNSINACLTTIPSEPKSPIISLSQTPQIKVSARQQTNSNLLNKNFDAILQKYKFDPRNVNFKVAQLKKSLKENFFVIFPNYSEMHSQRLQKKIQTKLTLPTLNSPSYPEQSSQLFNFSEINSPNRNRYQETLQDTKGKKFIPLVTEKSEDQLWVRKNKVKINFFKRLQFSKIKKISPKNNDNE